MATSAGGELLRLILAQRAAERHALEEQASTEGAAAGGSDEWSGYDPMKLHGNAVLGDVGVRSFADSILM